MEGFFGTILEKVVHHFHPDSIVQHIHMAFTQLQGWLGDVVLPCAPEKQGIPQIIQLVTGQYYVHIYTHTQTYYTMEKAVCNLIYNSSQLLLLVKQPILRVCGNYSSSCIQITSNLFTELKKILVNIKVHVHNEQLIFM